MNGYRIAFLALVVSAAMCFYFVKTPKCQADVLNWSVESENAKGYTLQDMRMRLQRMEVVNTCING